MRVHAHAKTEAHEVSDCRGSASLVSSVSSWRSWSTLAVRLPFASSRAPSTSRPHTFPPADRTACYPAQIAQSPDSGRSLGPVAASYGTWKSPITAQTVAAAALRLGSVALDGDDIYWIEGRPDDDGRNVIVKRSADGRIADVTPAGTNVRTRVHEYRRGRVHRLPRHRLLRRVRRPAPLSAGAGRHARAAHTAGGDWFYADCSIDPSRQRLVCVREDHTAKEREPVTTLVSLPLGGPPAAGEVIVSGHDFYSSPRLSPDGRRLAWLEWHHPNMPWDATQLFVADISALVRRRSRRGSLPGARANRSANPMVPGWHALFHLRSDGLVESLSLERSPTTEGYLEGSRARRRPLWVSRQRELRIVRKGVASAW